MLIKSVGVKSLGHVIALFFQVILPLFFNILLLVLIFIHLHILKPYSVLHGFTNLSLGKSGFFVRLIILAHWKSMFGHVG